MTFQIETDFNQSYKRLISFKSHEASIWKSIFDQNSFQMESEKTFTWPQMILFALLRPRVNYNQLIVFLINFVKLEHLRLAFIL